MLVKTFAAAILLVQPPSTPLEDDEDASNAARHPAQALARLCKDIDTERAVLKASHERLMQEKDDREKHEQDAKKALDDFDKAATSVGKLDGGRRVTLDDEYNNAKKRHETTGKQTTQKDSQIKSLDGFKEKVCTNASLENPAVLKASPDLPDGYFRAYGIDPCEDLKTYEAGLSVVNSSALVDLRAQCSVGAGSAAVIGAVALQAALGLGDVLQARAKQEVYEYAMELTGRKICRGWKRRKDPDPGHKQDVESKLEPRKDGGTAAPADAWAMYFPATCELLFPAGLSGSRSTPLSVKTAEIQNAAISDLMDFPVALTQRKLEKLKLLDSSYGRGLLSFLRGEAAAAKEIATGGAPLSAILTWRDRANEEWIDLARKEGSSKISCASVLRDPKSTHGDRTGCLLLLALEVSGARVETEESGMRATAAWLESGIRGFCRRYENTDDSTCLIGTDVQSASAYAKELQPLVVHLLKSPTSLVAIQSSINKLSSSGETPSVITQRVSRDVGLALRAVSDVVLETNVGKDFEKSRPKLKDLLRQATDAAAAISQQDYKRAIALAATVLEDEAAEEDLSKRKERQIDAFIEGVGFAADLASAESREEAASVIEGTISTKGRYQRKYGRNQMSLTLNGYVGGAGAYQFGRKTRGNTDDTAGLVRFTAPVGVDWTFLSKPRHHLGIFFSLLDPLAISTVDDDGRTAEIEFGALVKLGGFLRWGLFRSPFVLLGGISTSPWLNSGDKCSLEACWQGGVEIGGAIGVDIPLFFIR
jgi:hypothetical protein